MNVERLLLVLIFISLFAINYSFLDKKIAGFLMENNFQEVHVDRIIDGDTIKSGNQSIRLLGINTPERREKYHLEAKKFLENIILNETVSLEFGKDRKDKYGRTLAYVFYNGESINQKQIENGFANYYFLGKDKYYSTLKESWERCIAENSNLCEKSDDKCSQCIIVENIHIDEQEIVFKNLCNFSCDLTEWEIKDEGRKKFVFPNFNVNANSEFIVKIGNGTNTKEILFWNQKDYVWTKAGDTLFLRDSERKLVLWKDTRKQ